MTSRIQFALCGNCIDDEVLNPYHVVKQEIRQAILSLINREPMTPGSISEALKLPEADVAGHIKALQSAGLIEMVGSGWKPSFSIFSVRDQERLEPLRRDMTESLAEAVEENMDIVHKAYDACRFADHGFTFRDIAYILVGAYILDFGALTLERSDFLVAQKEMPGGSSVFAGFEGKLRSLQSNWMWGHTFAFGPITFLGHGELPPKGPRRAFPEQSYLWRREGWAEERITRTMQELGAILIALYDRPMGIPELAERIGAEQEELVDRLDLLKDMEYVRDTGVWTSLCPVVSDESRAEIQSLVEDMWEKLLSMAVKPNWGHLERLYRGTSPQRNGVDIREAFNPIHHAVFEQALQLLMERKVIASPGRHVDGARYAVWIEHTKIQDVTKP